MIWPLALNEKRKCNYLLTTSIKNLRINSIQFNSIQMPYSSLLENFTRHAKKKIFLNINMNCSSNNLRFKSVDTYKSTILLFWFVLLSVSLWCCKFKALTVHRFKYSKQHRQKIKTFSKWKPFISTSYFSLILKCDHNKGRRRQK